MSDSSILADGDDESQVRCRICLEDYVLSTLEDKHTAGLIAPCACSGTSKWIHRSCLDALRSFNQENIGFSQCIECHTTYVYEEKADDHPHWRRAHYHALVARDMILAVLAMHCILVPLALCIWMVDVSDNYDLLFWTFGERAECSTNMKAGIYYSWAWIISLALVGLITTLYLAALCCAQGGGGGGSSSGRYRGRGGGGSNSGGGGVGACLLITLVVLVILGLVVGIIGAIYYLNRVCREHCSRLYYRGETRQFVVKDLSIE